MIQKKQLEPVTNIWEPAVHSRFKIKAGWFDWVKFVSESTLVCISHSNEQKHCCQYIRTDSSILFQLQCPLHSVDKLLVVSEHEVVILNRNHQDQNCNVVLWNLQNNQFKTARVDLFEQKYYFNLNLYYFKESHALCVVEKSQKQRIRLTYFSLPELTRIHQYTCDHLMQNQQSWKWNEQVTIAQLNQRSMVGFIPRRFKTKESVCVSFYELDLHRSTGEFRKFIIDAGHILNPQRFDFLYAEIKDNWEVSLNQFYVQIQTTAGAAEYQNSPNRYSFKEEGEERYYTLYYNFEQHILKVSKINIPSAHRLQFINSIRSVRITEKEKKSLQQRIEQWESCCEIPEPPFTGVPIYYAEPDGKEVLMANHAIKNDWESEYQWPDCRSDLVFKIDRGPDCREVTVYQLPEDWHAYSCGVRVISAHWMTQLVEECWDDLLDSICNILCSL